MKPTALPVNFHIGIQRAGSSYLNNLFRAHPDISLSSVQEVNFYTTQFSKGTEWYLGTFDEKPFRIDTSPHYFIRGAEAAPRIAAALPDEHPKFLLIVRNPVDFLYSFYQLKIRYKQLHREYPGKHRNFLDFCRQHPEFVKLGKFYEQLNTLWLPYFSKDQFKIILFEEYVKNEQQAVQEILDFFGLPQVVLQAPPSAKNATLAHPLLGKVKQWVVQSKALTRWLKSSKWFNYIYNNYLISSKKLPADQRRQVAALLNEDVQNLGRFIGKPLTQWSDFDPANFA